MPNKRQKGMVLISIATIALFLFTNIFFISTNVKDIKKSNNYPGLVSNQNVDLAPVCGDLFCDYANGENPLNCPEDCYM
jgi:hypothetical protein